MKLIITDAASKWFRDEMGLQAGNGIKFYGKTYGRTEVHHGFSQGFTREDKPVDPILEIKKDGINYHVDSLDDWFFKGLITTVDYSAKDDGPVFHFQHEDGDHTPDVAGLAHDGDDHADNKADASTGASQK
ncbi:heme biosynthesis protein HemY [Limosilactobacillus sp. STM2_1]|uniref:Heme biosynthesis protein HemY n=1 Tax=Limosilactobacillus rudii TaxID=2759755 RepID=A0A7W3YMB9_9LACO|nr:heme biosynthesis protein HemY [Limosilactobacillus rudii]MBB1080122.1 heme biosynthesis protein HemY [Limosilactobacillus rudii]MBB1096390.1 heme biosynthesis protein HemY [Limosilactobacillus rudii]MCD7133609.1 heme biosynthesis protein HemY [Limosilactobacillus rudii]